MRDNCSRVAHAQAILGRRDRDPVALIEQSNKDRWQHLVPVRHSRMMKSAFAFFRGTALVQAYDLAALPRSGIEVHACGDCHLMNFGGFATPERNLSFDINDFDETFPAPFEWDLKRLAASVVLAGRWRAFDPAACQQAAERAVGAYQRHMQKRADAHTLDLWYDHIDFDDLKELTGGNKDFASRVDAQARRAKGRTSDHVFEQLTVSTGARPRLIDQPPLLYHVDPSEIDIGKEAPPFLDSYRATLSADRQALYDRFQLVDVAVKVVGVGSVGTRCLVALLMADDDDPLFLQIKEARASVLEGYAGPSRWQNNGERVVTGQRLMQAASDIFLGWSKGPAGRDFYVRQLRDMKVAARPETFTPRILRYYAEICDTALARAHAKAGDPATIAGYIGKGGQFREALAKYGVAYADQAEKDYALFQRAVRSGQLASDTNLTPAAAMLR